MSDLAASGNVSDLAVLGIVVVVLALSECALWSPHGAVIVSAPLFFGRATLRVLSKSLGNARGAFTLLNPLPPFGRSYVVEPWPFSVSDDGISALRSFSLAHERRPAPIDRRFSWSEIERVKADEREVRINGKPFARCASRAHARAAVKAIERIRGGARVDDVIADHLDPNPVRANATRHAQLGIGPMIGATGLFVSLFAIAPRMVMTEGLARWPLLLALIFAWVLATMLTTYVAHKALHPHDKGERAQLVLLMLPAPTTALRVNDKLGRFLLAGSHPIAAARAFGLDDVVKAAVRDLKNPRPLPVSDQIEIDFRHKLLEQLKDVAIDYTPRGACPRCLTTYRDAKECADCEIPLEPEASPGVGG